MIYLTPGEPAGIGPELVLRLVHQQKNTHQVCIVADPDLLKRCAQRLELPAELPENVNVLPINLKQPEIPGQLNSANGHYVLDCLTMATQACLKKPQEHALVTGPVHKGIINDAGIEFSGHTGFLADLCDTDHVVMLLGDTNLQVALQTTHIPLCEVSKAITQTSLIQTLSIIQHDFATRMQRPNVHIKVLGLNPHAGEGGYLGREEIEIITPAIEQARKQGINVSGPVSGDTAFTPENLHGIDVILAMYHDQGLAPLKAQGFGKIVNTTLGLPIIRTSVDHGTALDLVELPINQQQRASTASLEAAFKQALNMLGTH